MAIPVFFLAPGPLTRQSNLAPDSAGQYSRSRSLRAVTRRGAAAVHPALRRRQAKSPLPAHLLHLRVERRAELCPAQPQRSAHRGAPRIVVHEVDLPLCLPSAVCNDSAGGRGRRLAARAPLDQRRRHGAAVLLRLRLGSNRRAGASAGALEDPAADTHGEPDEARCLCQCAPPDGSGCVSRRLPRTRPIIPGESTVAD
jgi:hypothetical protein